MTDLSPQTRELHDIINTEDDLACALICASFMDECLRSLLEKRLLASKVTGQLLDPTRGTIGSFAARTSLAYCLALIPKTLYVNLTLFAEIRNLFAHSHLGGTFTSVEIAECCLRLTYPHVDGVVAVGFEGQADTSAAAWPSPDDPRSRFTIVAVLAVSRLLLTGLGTEELPRQEKGW